MKDSYAPLKEKGEEEDRDPGCWKRWFGEREKVPPTVAETISMLQQTRLQLQLNMNSCKQNADKHEQKMRNYHSDLQLKSAALREFRMRKRYFDQYDKWHAMYISLETVQSEIQSQQQAFAVFGAYARANEAMGKLADRVDMTSLCDMLDTLRDRMQEGKDVSDALGSAFSDSMVDSDDLEREFENFMSDQKKTRQSVSSAASLSTRPATNNNNNHDRLEGEQKKNIFFSFFFAFSPFERRWWGGVGCDAHDPLRCLCVSGLIGGRGGRS